MMPVMMKPRGNRYTCRPEVRRLVQERVFNVAIFLPKK